MQPRFFSSVFVFAVMVLLTAGQSFGETSALVPPPDGKEVSKSKSIVYSIFSDDFDRAKSARDKAKLSKQLLDSAAKITDDEPGRFALLMVAKELAIKGGGRDTILSVSRAIAERYQPAADEPVDGNDQFEKAQNLWKESQEADGEERLKLEAEAAVWYARAANKVSSLERMLCEKRAGGAVFGGEIATLKSLKTFEIKASEEWQPTIRVRKGERITIIASGDWYFAPKGKCGPDGLKEYCWLRGKIGNGKTACVFKIGKAATFIAAIDGMLYMEMFDTYRSDNSGVLTVKVFVGDVASAIDCAIHFSFEKSDFTKGQNESVCVKDRSGKGNNGLAVNVKQVDGKFGQAAEFDGNAYVEVQNSATLNFPREFSVCAWVLAVNPDSGGRIISKHDWADRKRKGFVLLAGRNAMQIAIGCGLYKKFQNLGTPIPSTKWHHIAATFDGQKSRIYLDGKQSGEMAATMDPSLYNLRIGYPSEPRDTIRFSGKIDEVYVFTRVISDDEISLLSAKINKVFVAQATYGITGSTADVTEAFSYAIDDGKSVRIDDGVMGANPAPGKSKTLWVVYNSEGKAKTVSFRQLQTIRINEESGEIVAEVESTKAVNCEKNDDLKILVGVWRVSAGNSYRGQWVFQPNGTVMKDGRSPGTWSIDGGKIKIIWTQDNVRESFSRPLSAVAVSGDSPRGTISAVKIDR